jgi:hypothetical protein
MSLSGDLAYFSRRFVEEMDLGDQAASASIAAIHYEMAHRYSLIVRAHDGKPALTLVSSSRDRSASDFFVSFETNRETASN